MRTSLLGAVVAGLEVVAVAAASKRADDTRSRCIHEVATWTATPRCDYHVHERRLTMGGGEEGLTQDRVQTNGAAAESGARLTTTPMPPQDGKWVTPMMRYIRDQSGPDVVVQYRQPSSKTQRRQERQRLVQRQQQASKRKVSM